MEKLVIFVTILVCRWSGLNGDINMTEYYRMPPMYELEDFDRCMEEFPNTENLYCFTRTQIKPNESSDLWLHIQISFDPNTFPNALLYKGKYDKHINICVNYKLSKQYGLMAYSGIEYCISSTASHSTDVLDVIVAVMFFSLLIIIASSTIFDFILKLRNLNRSQHSEHYKNPVLGAYAPVAVAFSIPRNWYRLITKSDTQTVDDHRPIQALRFLTMFCVIMAHCVLFDNIMPVLNPQYTEQNLYRVVIMILANGTIIIQTFFAICGYLMSMRFTKLQEQSKFSLKYFWTAIVNRYLRLTPVYLFVILFHSTWLAKLQSGPLGPFVMEMERTNCRNNGWANLLYINNFVTASEPCVQQGWYLAADFQMFIVGVAMQLLIWKYPRCKKFVLSFAVFLSLIVPGVVTYVHRYDGIFLIRAEMNRYAHFFDDYYHNVYIPSYMNFGSFVSGMIGGMVYKSTKSDNKKTIPHILWYVMIPASFLLILSAFIFYEYDFAKPAIWISIYSALFRNLWGLFITLLITGMAFGYGSIIKDIMSHPIFLSLGRLTFCAYLIHVSIMRMMFGNLRQPIWASDAYISIQTFALLSVSYIAALLLHLGLELPTQTLQKHFLGTRDKTSTRTEQLQMK